MRRSVGQWEIMTGWADEVEEDEHEDAEEVRSDGDILGEVQDSSGRRRRRRPRPEDGIPHEEQWETDLEAFQPGQASTYAANVVVEAHRLCRCLSSDSPSKRIQIG